MVVFNLFTEGARQVIVFAQEEARNLKHDEIGTEHILLGLLLEGEGLAARVLGALDVTVERVRVQVLQIVGSGGELASGQIIPFTPAAKRGLELALREAHSLGHNYIGTEHILLGLVSENDGGATREGNGGVRSPAKPGGARGLLLDFDADSQKIRNEIIRMLSSPGGPTA